MPRRLLGSGIALVIAMASCRSPEVEAIRIGILADCEGFGAPFYDVVLAGAALPLLSRGGRVDASQLRDGVDGASVGGHPVEISLGCAGDSISAIVETRRLVELHGVDVVIGPNVFPNTPGIGEYAARHPETTFVLATMEHLQGLPLSSNVFRFTADSVQTAAGLGSYAFNELGWRRADVIALPTLWEWGTYAGFTAEFCSLGGGIGDRYWLELPHEDLPALIAKIPIDRNESYFLAADPDSALRFLRRVASDGHSLEGKVILGSSSIPIVLDPALVDEFGDQLTGFVTASFVPLDRSVQRWNSYVAEFESTFPSLAEAGASAFHLFDIDYYNAMEAVMLGLEHVDGDLGDDGRRFQRALASVTLDAPNGTIALDDDRQAIVPIYLSTVVEGSDGTLSYRTLDMIDGVDDTYGGALRVSEPLPDRTQPRCVEDSPPPWASVVS